MHRVVELCQLLGYEFPMDWDGQISIESPGEVDARIINKFLMDNREQVERHLRCKAKNAFYVYIGGPLNHQRHHYFYSPIHKQDEGGKWVATDLPYIGNNTDNSP